MKFKELFKLATGGYEPFPYQQRMAEFEKLPELINVPTGCGKTAAVFLNWYWKLMLHPDPQIRSATPRRLVYCLPMRTLVEQVKNSIKEMLLRINEHDDRASGVGVHILMGGETGEDWLLCPEKNQVLIGTQDMLLSRALNRGYAMSRFRWPVAFGWLQNDCQWVLDEVQLMQNGLPTSAQIAAFNREMGAFAPNRWVWMSATLQQNWLETVDFAPYTDNIEKVELTQEDRKHPYLKDRLYRDKKVNRLDLTAGKESKKYFAALAGKVLEHREKGRLNLVVLNRVERAQQLYKELKKQAEKQAPGCILRLLHSRFRPAERAVLNQKITEAAAKSENGEESIIISTQAIEAGVDISAAALFTDLAPWASIVQRMGRCNRYGELEVGKVYWIDLDNNNAAPYQLTELNRSRDLLNEMEGKSASPEKLPRESLPFTARYILRRKDMWELFDTTPDLSGTDLDVSRFIRDTDDTDVYFFWRDFNKNTRPSPDLPAPGREELCAASIWQARAFLKQLDRQNTRGFRWDHLDGRWIPVNEHTLRPGMIILIPAESGGYSTETGWHGKTGEKVEPVGLGYARASTEDTTGDQLTFAHKSWETLAEHSDKVVEEMRSLLDNLNITDNDSGLEKVLLLAARFHDLGKAHQVFQETMAFAAKKSASIDAPTSTIWAKTPVSGLRHRQPYFRHELASALALYHNNKLIGLEPGKYLDLLLYLVAAHHGKIRLSIRSLPGEKLPTHVPAGTKITRGIWEGSCVQEAKVGANTVVPETTLNLELMEMGAGRSQEPSWLERTLNLLDSYGLFKLAYLEALLRAADIRASTSREENNESEVKA